MNSGKSLLPGRKGPNTGLWLRARRAAASELKLHPLRYLFRFSACIAFAYMLATQQITQGHMDPLWCGFLILFLSLTLARLFSSMFSKGQQVRDWAIEEQEHSSMAMLSGKSQEELEKLLQYHLKYGNLAEADRISQKLLAMVDESPTAQKDAGTASAVPPPADKPNKGLPSWMQQGEQTSSDEQVQDKAKRPDWMQ